jgi:hypothetical protein
MIYAYTDTYIYTRHWRDKSAAKCQLLEWYIQLDELGHSTNSVQVYALINSGSDNFYVSDFSLTKTDLVELS